MAGWTTGRSKSVIAASISAGLCRHVLVPIGRKGYSETRIGDRVQQMPQFRTIGEFEMPLGAIAPAQLYAPMARRHMEMFGTKTRSFAEIAVTVRNHIQGAMDRLGAHSRLEAVMSATIAGLL